MPRSLRDPAESTAKPAAKSRRTGKPRGNPAFVTKYTPQMCDKIVSLMAGGLSATAAAAELNLARKTLYNWEEAHPEFAAALDMGRIKRQAFLEKRLLSARKGPVVTSSIFALKNANPKEWRDKQELEHTGKDGGAIHIEDVTRDADAFARSMARLAAGIDGGKIIDAEAGSASGTELAVEKLVGKAKPVTA